MKFVPYDLAGPIIKRGTLTGVFTMTNAEMRALQPGNIVRSVPSGLAYVVLANYGDRISSVRYADITNPSEWEIVCLKPTTVP